MVLALARAHGGCSERRRGASFAWQAREEIYGAQAKGRRGPPLASRGYSRRNYQAKLIGLRGRGGL